MESRPGRGRTSVAAAVASMISLVAALSCCLPLGTLLMAVGASVVSETLRPWLLIFSVVCLAFAFVQTYFRDRCEFRQRRLRTVLLWFSAITVTAMLALPNQFATLISGRLPSFTASGSLIVFDTAAFERDFNAASNHTRVLLLLSPT